MSSRHRFASQVDRGEACHAQDVRCQRRPTVLRAYPSGRNWYERRLVAHRDQPRTRSVARTWRRRQTQTHSDTKRSARNQSVAERAARSAVTLRPPKSPCTRSMQGTARRVRRTPRRGHKPSQEQETAFATTIPREENWRDSWYCYLTDRFQLRRIK